MRTAELFAFIKERHAIYERRKAGQKPPWTKDPILAKYRFCNVYRELDTVTVWIANNLRGPSPFIVPTLVAARLINRISTLEKLKGILNAEGWTAKCADILREVRATGRPVITNAYMVRTPHGMDKISGLDHILTPIQAAAFPFTETLEEAHQALMKFDYLGGFIAAQVIADLKFVKPWTKCQDWWTFAASGPGSRRGLNRVCDMPADQPWDEEEWREDLRRLQNSIDPLISKAKMPRLSRSDLQNCLCEWDKYQRALLGEGEPKQLYKPGINDR